MQGHCIKVMHDYSLYNRQNLGLFSVIFMYYMFVLCVYYILLHYVWCLLYVVFVVCIGGDTERRGLTMSSKISKTDSLLHLVKKGKQTMEYICDIKGF